jgi:monofunctional biosynthetic peptidoglycan transglycosylase
MARVPGKGKGRRAPMATRRRGSGAKLVRLAWRGVAWALAAIATVFVALQFWYFSHVLWWTQVDPQSTAFMRAELDRLRAKNPRATIDFRWVPYEAISDDLKRAVIASEDARFGQHRGVDWSAIEAAFEKNAERGRVAFGGSTITMQLAKNLFLSGERSYLRKAQEVLIAWMLEAVMSKRRILEIYLNVAEWGQGVFGAEAAARHHFRVSAAQLGPAQAARLAAMLPRPRYYDRNPGSGALARRAETVQRWMRDVTPP